MTTLPGAAFKANKISKRDFSDEHRRKLSIALTGRHLSEDTKRKISIIQKGGHRNQNTEFKKGHKTNLGKKFISNRSRGSYIPRTPLSEEHKLKISKSNKVIMNKPEIRKHLRIKTLEHIKKIGGLRIGKNETKILDEIEKNINHKIIRHYPIAGYELDGYIPELNHAIEIDEPHHFTSKNIRNDYERENEIRKEINCTFVRIDEQKFLDNLKGG